MSKINLISPATATDFVNQGSVHKLYDGSPRFTWYFDQEYEVAIIRDNMFRGSNQEYTFYEYEHMPGAFDWISAARLGEELSKLPRKRVRVPESDFSEDEIEQAVQFLGGDDGHQ